MADGEQFTIPDFSDGEGSNGQSESGVVDPAALIGGTSSDSGDDYTYDPERHISPDKRNADGSYRRKRQRRGSGSAGSAAKEKAVPYNLSAVEGILLNIHAVLGTRVPELTLEQTEARKLAEAFAEVQRHYPQTVFSPKIAAWLNMGMVAASVYVPRAVNIRARLQSEQAEPEQTAPIVFPNFAG